MSKEDLRQDFEDSPEIIQSGLYKHTYIDEYDTPGGEPIAALISAYEFDASAQMSLCFATSPKYPLLHICRLSALQARNSSLRSQWKMSRRLKILATILTAQSKSSGNRFRDTDDARYIGLVMPRVLGRLPYGPDTVPVRSFNYVEEVKGPDHDKYLWTNASFAFASNMVRSFINNGWCVQIRGPQAGGAFRTCLFICTISVPAIR